MKIAICEKHKKSWIDHTIEERDEHTEFSTRSKVERSCSIHTIGEHSIVPLHALNHSDEQMAEHEGWTIVLDYVPAEEAQIETVRLARGSEFKEGFVSDLQDDEGERIWSSMGKQYVPGLGPMIKTPDELKTYMELTGHVMKGQRTIREVRDVSPTGYVHKRARKVVDVSPFDREMAIGADFRRPEKDDYPLARRRQIERDQIAEQKRIQREKDRQNTKKFFFT